MRRLQILIAIILSLNLFAVPAVFAAPTRPANQNISTPVPTSPINAQPSLETGTHAKPPLGLTLFLLSFCCVFLLLIGVFILGIVVRRPTKKNSNN